MPRFLSRIRILLRCWLHRIRLRLAGGSGIAFAARLAALGMIVLGLAWTIQEGRFARDCAAADWPSAVAVAPRSAPAWRALAQARLLARPAAAERAAWRAVRVEPADWRNWQILAQIQVERGELRPARASMAAMLKRSREFEAAWNDANLLLLSGDSAGFWQQAARALSIAPARRLSATLAFLRQAADGDWRPVSATVATARAEAPNCLQSQRLEDGYFSDLMDRAAPAALAAQWPRLLAADSESEGPAACRAAADPSRRSLAAQYLNMLLASGAGDAARRGWQSGLAVGVFPPDWGPSDGQLVADPELRRVGENVAVASPLAWRLCPDCGPFVFPAHGSGLQLEFHGLLDETPALAQQWLLLAPGASYWLRFAARARSANASGVFVGIETNAGRELIRLAAPATPDWQTVTGRFVVPRLPASFRLRIGYQRPLGEMPLRGVELLRAFAVQPAAAVGGNRP